MCFSVQEQFLTTQKEHLEAVNAASAAEAKEKAMEQRLNKAKADLEEHQRVQKEAAGSDTAVQAKYKVRAILLCCCHDGGAWC